MDKGNNPENNQSNPPPPGNLIYNLPIPLIILFLIIAFFVGLIISAWYFQSKLEQLTMVGKQEEKIVQKESLVIGTDASFQPMEYVSDQGEVMGFDIDLGNSIASELGMKVKFKNMSWDNLFAGLEKRQIDVIISSVTITDERKETYNFSDPYINAGQVIITRKESQMVSSVESLRGKKIAVQKGTTNEQEAYKFTDRNLVILYDDFTSVTRALVEEKVDAMFSDFPGAKGIIVQNPGLKIASDPFTNEYYGAVIRKDDTQLQKQINEAINSLRTKGILIDLKQKWLD